MRTDDAAVSPWTPMVAPKPDTEWSPMMAAEWSALWESQLASNYMPSDLPGLRRLFALRSQLERALDRAGDEPEVAGSMGQKKLSPWFDEAHKLESAIQKLEDRYGLTPMARLRLGITLVEGQSLAARNRELLEAFHANQDD